MSKEPIQRTKSAAVRSLGSRVDHIQEVSHAEAPTIAERHAALRSRGKAPLPDTFLARVIYHPRFETFGGCVVLFNFLIMTMETQGNATKDDSILDFVAVVNRLLLVYYTLECAVRVYVMKKSFFLAMWNNLDFLIVITGLIGEIVELATEGAGGAGMDQIAMLKSLRMLRLIRLLRLLVAFRELYVLIAGIGRCMKTLFWASGLIFIVLNVWAILSVEYLDARVQELVPSGAFIGCSWCETAFANIWYANLTWFQIVSTADWSSIGRPLAEEFVWPYMFFVLNVFIVIWGLLNLIVAAIVDANIAAREDDVAVAAKVAAQAHKEAWTSFADLCKLMDEDGSGDISVDEFKKFWRENIELQQHLTIMGVQEKDVDHLLALMDEDGSGTLEQSEFIEQFTSMRTLVEKTALFFLLKFAHSTQAKLITQSEVVQRICRDIADMRRHSDPEYIPSEIIDKPLEPALSSNKTWTPLPRESKKPVHAFKAQVPDVDMKKLPSGWYYFGSSLPHEATFWCKPMDSARFNEAIPYSTLQTKEVAFAEDRKKWEPVPPSGVHIHANRIFGCRGDIDVASPEPTTSQTVGETRTSEHDLSGQGSLQTAPWDASLDHGSQEDLALAPYTCSGTRKMVLSPHDDRDRPAVTELRDICPVISST